MNKKEFKNFNTEVMLQVLKNADIMLQRAKQENDIEKIKVIEEDVIPKYEKLYLAMKELDIRDKSDEEIQGFRDNVLMIAKKNNLSVEFINECVAKREELKSHSGAEVTKRMFEYALKGLKKKRGILLDNMKKLLKDEEQAEKDLKECIQYDDEMRVSALIVDIREKKREVQALLEENDSEIGKIKKDLENSWKYEIYGTISREALQESI